ncbi:MAG: hypothetical protein ABR538_00125 [Candidatus Binatia bacterium]
MKTKWILAAAATVATLTNGCMAFQEIAGSGGESNSYSSSDNIESDDRTFAESAPTSDDEVTSQASDATDRAADATSRAAAAADRAAAVAARASMNAETTEQGFQKSLRK